MHHLEQFKTSIDVVTNQEKEYEQNFKRYTTKEIELKQKDDETPQETIDRKETQLNQIVDLNDRNKLNIQSTIELRKLCLIQIKIIGVSILLFFTRKCLEKEM